MIIERDVLCALRPWCVLAHGHEGACAEVPRIKQPPTDFGPNRKDRKR